MKIISNTAISLDGKIATAFEPLHFMGSGADQKRMFEIRDLADAVLVGGNTFRNWPHARVSWNETREPLINVVLTRSGNLELTEQFLDEPRVEPLILTSNPKMRTSRDVETILCESKLTPEWIVEQLERRDVKTLLLECGGDVLFQFLEKDMLDEMHVTMCPRLIGGHGVPSLVGGIGFDQNHMKNLEIISSQIVGSEMFLHYRVL